MFDVKDCGCSNVKEEEKIGNVRGVTKEQQKLIMTEQQTKEWLAEQMNVTLQRLNTNPKTREFVAAFLKFTGQSTGISITANSFDKLTNGDSIEAEKFYSMSKRILQQVNQSLDKWDSEAQNK